MAGSAPNSRPSTRDGQTPPRPGSRASQASSEVSFEFQGTTSVSSLGKPFGDMMKKNTTLKKLKTAASLADKAKKIEAKNGGKAVKVKGGLIKGKEHVSAKTSDGKVVSVRMFDENNTWLDTVHLTETGAITYKLPKNQQTPGNTDGRIA